jgi:HlyD family secretion protein
MKKAVLLVLAVAVLAGAGYYIYHKKTGQGKSEYVTEKAQVGDVTSSVSATGKLNPKVTVLVGTEVSGTVRRISVDYNSVVKKGQVLLALDQEIFRTQVDQARASLRNAESKHRELVAGREMNRSDVKTSIDQKKAALDKAEADYQRSQELFDRGMIARQDLDSAREAYLVSKSQSEQSLANTAKNNVTDAQIAEAKAMVDQARANLRTADTNLSKTVITAPMDGVVVDRNIEVGQTVAASFNTPTLLTIGELKMMQVEVSIDEADVGQVAVGQKARFTVDAFPDKVFMGKVSKIYYAPVTVQNVVTYTGIIDVENPEILLRPGMTANVKIITSQKKGVLLVPSAALRVKMGNAKKTKPAAGGGGRTVWVMKAGKPEPVKVTTGVTDFVNTEITSGLSAGDDVVVDVLGAGEKKNQGQGGAPRGGPMRM